MLTGTQIKIMQVFVSRITEKFRIQHISKIIGKPYPLVHRYFKPLVKNNIIKKDDYRLFYLDYKENHSELAYIESVRKNNFLKKNKTLQLFARDVFEALKKEFFIFLVFGSAVDKKKPRDIDILFIVENIAEVSKIEKVLHRIASNFSAKFDINVISAESAKDMIIRRDEPNVLNETLNKHIIIFGAENYYRLLKNAR